MRVFEVKIGSDAFELVSEFPSLGGHKHHHDGAADLPATTAAHTRFARELCHALSQGLNSHRCGRFIIIAATQSSWATCVTSPSQPAKAHQQGRFTGTSTTLNPRELAELAPRSPRLARVRPRTASTTVHHRSVASRPC